MRRRSLLLVLLALLFACAMHAGVARPVRADDKYYYWEYILVDITIRDNGDLDVIETQRYVFVYGTFTFAYREIPLKHLTSIDHVWVEDDGRPLGRDRVLIENRGNTLYIRWTYPPTRSGYQSAETFRIHYTVHGATRIYEDGDEVWWGAIGGDRDGSIGSSRVTVRLPGPVAPESIEAAAYGIQAKTSIVGPQTIAFTSGSILGYKALEVRVRFPHGLVQATPAPWQAGYDRQVAYYQNVRPGVTLLTTVFSLFALIMGCLGVHSWRYLLGRSSARVVATYISEPPGEMAPGLAGLLLDQRASMRHIVATLVDLAHRGVIQMAESAAVSIYSGERDYVFHLLRRSAQVRPYETEILGWFFPGGRRERWLSELTNKFYVALPEIQQRMYAEAVGDGLFPRHPEVTSWNYGIAGVLTLLAGVALAILGGMKFNAYSGTAFLPGLALAGVGLYLAVVAGSMPRWTPKGAERAARWRAFKRYLADIERYTDLAAAKAVFERYLPFAIAFGLDKGWVGKFARIGAPAPAWYIPLPAAIAGGAVAGSLAGSAGALSPALGRAATPSLDGMSRSLASSLQGMSDGLLGMVNSASTILASSPVPVAAGAGTGWRTLFRIIGGASGGGGGGAG